MGRSKKIFQEYVITASNAISILKGELNFREFHISGNLVVLYRKNDKLQFLWIYS